ncbi:MAG TPA: ABC transporter ATP-binding protein [Acetobacteraceae bacterium]|nr:ABC transporter ATP-binding protein [Acetobacteraceae bacterium]
MRETTIALTDRAPSPVGGAAPLGPPLLRIDRVSLRYDLPKGQSVLALDTVSIDVTGGEFAVIVGPSGCGKSSLLYLVAGLVEPSDGDIFLQGEAVRGPGAARGMVFQAYTLFPWLTVWENVEFGLRRRRMPAAERRPRVAHYLDEVGLTQFAEAYPKQLSGGMMQRVAIARALANDPQVLLMDEPFGALDSQTRLSMQKLLLRVWEHNHKTVLFVTHDIDEAILLGDRVLVMSPRPGRIQESIAVNLPRPRTLAMVMEPEFIAIKRQIVGLLHGVGEEEE